MRLYHFSEDPAIARFEPRSPRARPEVEPLVWAVDEAHQAAYLFPRDCPRVLLWATPNTTPEDRERWLGPATPRMLACVEWDWREALLSTQLHCYELPPASFAPLRDDPWMWVSREPVRPLQVQPVGPLLDALAAEGVELRLVPSLAPYAGAWESSLHVSGIRLRNARTWPGGTP